MSEYEVTIEQEIADTQVKAPHVVILGAGASRATCLEGDKNGHTLPLMSDFSEIVGLKTMLSDWGYNPDVNFEEIFSDLFESGSKDKIHEISAIVESYFNKLKLPDKPTIYDHLVLSLRGKDLIATFNWDPLLLQAYTRNSGLGMTLPNLAFLHGNVLVGYCEGDKICGLAGRNCTKCGNPFRRSELLYPIKNKNYAENSFINSEWNKLKLWLKHTIMITIYGYSAPKTDQEAISAMKEAWGNVNERTMEQTDFITIQNEDEITSNWKPFIFEHHYEIQDSFYKSRIANHPRRTGEAYYQQFIMANFIEENPIPKEMGFSELWEWFRKFKEPEEKA